jgi:hypothetical protein
MSNSIACLMVLAMALTGCTAVPEHSDVSYKLPIPLRLAGRPLAHVYRAMEDCFAIAPPRSAADAIPPEILQGCAGAAEVIELRAQVADFKVSWRRHGDTVRGPSFADTPHIVPAPDASDLAQGLKYRLLLCYEAASDTARRSRRGLSISSSGLVARLYDLDNDTLLATAVYRDISMNVTSLTAFRNYGRKVGELAALDLFK